MATSRPADPPDAPQGYLAWSKDPAVGVFAVLPLWIAYEVLRLTLAPQERNGAEALVADTLTLFGPAALHVLRVLMALTVVAAAVSILRPSFSMKYSAC